MQHHAPHNNPTELHAQITADAAKATAQAQQSGPIPHSEFLTLEGLIEGAAEALKKALPTRFQHHGKTYRLMIDIQRAQMAIFDGMYADESMLVAEVGTFDERGQRRP